MRRNCFVSIMATLGSMALLGSSCASNSSSEETGNNSNSNGNLPACIDEDSDGYGAGCNAGSDCDDANIDVHPGAPEVCNGVDDNCNGTRDEGLTGCLVEEVCTPSGEVALDENGNGDVDEGCGCTLGETQACCVTGIQVCIDQGGEFGSEWGPCEGGLMEPELCGDGIDQNCDGLDDDCPDVEVACNSSTHQQATFALDFPGSNADCPWGEGDNNPVAGGGGEYTARIEHVRSLALPPNAAICSLDFNVPQTGMYYDDMFMLAFDEAMLISSNPVDPFFTNQNGLFIYDWAQIRGQQEASGPLYCLAGGPCELPETENQGIISLNLDQAITYVLAQRALNLHRYDFLVVAIGDNNPSVDCTYSPFTLEVQVEYVLP